MMYKNIQIDGPFSIWVRSVD